MSTDGTMNVKRVLVTGSGTGVGTGVALEFAKEGAAVALHYSHSAEGALQAVQEIRSGGGKAEAFQADFNETEQVRRLGRQAVEFLGGLDVLVAGRRLTGFRKEQSSE